MGVRYSVEGSQKSLDCGQVNFEVKKKFSDVPDWLWPKPYEFEDFTLDAKLGKGATVSYYWREGEISGEGDDLIGNEKRDKKDVKPGERRQIGSITFEGY